MKKIIFSGILFVISFVLTVGVTFVYGGIIPLQSPSSLRFPVRGIDVSSYQADIDFDKVAAQGIDFVFIKATEGSGHSDRYFAQNLENANRVGLRTSAYHFFSFDSGADTQAANFMSLVPIGSISMPPVIDFEFYGEWWEKNLPDIDDACVLLSEMSQILERYYDVKPIIYCDEKMYDIFLSGREEFTENPIWIRNIFKELKALSDGRKWTFWQYSNRTILPGIKGHVDMNVFDGSREEFDMLGVFFFACG
jgi:Lyzozyme M1 (1,4-beta-N-acetylmuramidase)